MNRKKIIILSLMALILSFLSTNSVLANSKYYHNKTVIGPGGAIPDHALIDPSRKSHPYATYHHQPWAPAYRYRPLIAYRPPPPHIVYHGPAPYYYYNRPHRPYYRGHRYNHKRGYHHGRPYGRGHHHGKPYGKGRPRH